MRVEVRQRTALQRRWSTISAIVASNPRLLLPSKTPLRETRRYTPTVDRHVMCAPLPELGVRRETKRHLAATTMNPHRDAGVKSFNDVVTAPDPRLVPCPGQQLVLWPALAEWETNAAPRARVSTTAKTRGRRSRRRQRQPFDASLQLPTRPPFPYP